MGDADAVAGPPADRAWLEDQLRRIEEHQSRLDQRRALFEVIKPTPEAVVRSIEDRDVLAAERDRLAAEWDRLAAERDATAGNRDAHARERERAQGEGPDAGLARTTREARTVEQDREASRRERKAARDDRERSALDRDRAAEDRARARDVRGEQAALEDRVSAAAAALGGLLSAEEEAELAHQLAGALLEQLALTETDEYRLQEFLRQAGRERARAQAAGKRAEHIRAQLSDAGRG